MALPLRPWVGSNRITPLVGLPSGERLARAIEGALVAARPEDWSPVVI